MLTEAKNTVTGTAEGAKNIVVKKSTAIWQKFLLYPAVFAALFGAIPTIMDIYNAYKYDVKYRNVKHGEEQTQLWTKNFECYASLNYQKVRTDQDAEVQVGACPNGDVLISVLQADGERVAEWIPLEKFSNRASLSLFSSQAFAATFTPKRVKTGYYSRSMIHKTAAKSETMCQELIKAEAKIFRVIKEEGICYSETVEMMKGKVSKRKIVPCDTQCKPQPKK